MIGPPPSTSVEVTQCDQGMNGRYAPDVAYPARAGAVAVSERVSHELAGGRSSSAGGARVAWSIGIGATEAATENTPVSGDDQLAPR